MTSAGAVSDKVLNRVLLLLAPAITIVVATEFIVVGLLPLVSQEMHLPLAKAGQLVGWWAFSAAVAGPFVTLVVSRQSPHLTLIATLILFAIGNAIIAVTTSFDVMLLIRIIQGAMLPAFVSVGASVVTRLAPPAERGKGLARANIGFVLGVLLALPAGVALAQGGDWRLSFVVLAVASLPMAALIAIFFPAIPQGEAPSIPSQIGLLRRSTFLANLALSVLLFAAMFAAYTYLGAWMEGALGLSVWSVTLTLFLFGVAGLVGNVVAARIADGAPLRATAIAILMLVASINLAALVQGSIFLAAIPLALWGISHTASVTLSQVRVTLAGNEAPAFAMTMNISAANLGIAIGAFGGGWLIDQEGVGAIGLAPIGFAVFAIPLTVFIGRNVARRATPTPASGSAHRWSPP
ncbi:MFS transporter [Glacieibacterium frigidum]|uniref:MFS transporter n=1 Tax=Glacieibacterium frigidum TaxID=2593303 RepID=A0A552U8C4_9SPHN|nr:MFS transporter [Glacieibacterium frigidum]TRW14468.1 MFS transporter [Glacieibacterium frigidum]